MNTKRARLREVADRAGVAFITAWRALNATHLVSEETRKKVEAAAEEVGYLPNTVARSLVSSTSGVIGVVVPTLYDSIFADTVQGVADVVRPAGVELLIGLSDYDMEREADIIKAFLGRQIDGLILTGREHTPSASGFLKSSGIPIVETWDYGDAAIDAQIGFSSFHMARDVTLHLADKGYHQIAFAGTFSRHRSRERQLGYEAALAERHLGPPLLKEAPPDLDGGAEALAYFLDQEASPDVIFFNGDTMAYGALFAAQEALLKVPDDIALFGVHDLDISRHLRPELSTVDIPRYRMGADAAEHIMARLNGETSEGCAIDLGFTIMDRGTTR